MKKSKNHPKDKWILICFLAFFGVIFTLDGIFVYTAISTQTGVVTEHAYKKGLQYNDLLSQAKNQPKLVEEATYESPILRWKLADKHNKPIKNATITARIIRPIQDGHDFNIVLNNKGNGIYETSLTLPLKGLWVAKLESQWNKNTYKTTYKFITK